MGFQGDESAIKTQIFFDAQIRQINNNNNNNNNNNIHQRFR